MPLTYLFSLFLAAAPPAVHLKIVDEHGRPAAARVRLFDAQGKPQPVRSAEPMLAAHPRIAMLGAVVRGECRVLAPEGRSLLRVDRGGEYRPREIPVDAASGDQEHTVRLERWIDMAARGWYSGDLHVHRLPVDMPLLMDAANLHWAPTITRWNHNSSLDVWPAQRVYYSADRRRAYSIDNAEDERGWGAVLLLSLKAPVRLYHGKNDWNYPLANAAWSEARREGGFIDLEKPIWWGAPVAVALYPPDTIGVVGNHFMEESVMESEAWGRPRDKARYPGGRGLAEYSMQLYYNYLNAGWRIAASAGSANGVMASPLGHNRSYVRLERPFSFETWLAAQKRGRNFVTNGPMLFLTVAGEEPGATLPATLTRAPVKLEALSSGELEKAEIVVDGVVVAQFFPSGDPSRIHGAAIVEVRPGGWVAARSFEKHPLSVRFAHTSPVYIGPTAARSRAALDFFRDWVDAEMRRIESIATLTPAQREESLATCRRARRVYE